MDPGLIFDVGLHNGEDTEFYLKKGFRVVGIEADPVLAEGCRKRFASAVASGQLIIVNKAVGPEASRGTFYRNKLHSHLGTLDKDYAERNVRRFRAHSEAIEVEVIPIDAMFSQFGVPYYLKVDIEGMDTYALSSLTQLEAPPRYVSIESELHSWSGLGIQFSLFNSAGYNAFKIVKQHEVPNQWPPNPSLEGVYTAHRFEFGASGLFGEETPGAWLTSEAAVRRFRRIYLKQFFFGDEGLAASRYSRGALRRLGLYVGWYDTHARRGGLEIPPLP
jgi:FkbM family methyltransferase